MKEGQEDGRGRRGRQSGGRKHAGRDWMLTLLSGETLEGGLAKGGHGLLLQLVFLQTAPCMLHGCGRSTHKGGVERFNYWLMWQRIIDLSPSFRSHLSFLFPPLSPLPQSCSSLHPSVILFSSVPQIHTFSSNSNFLTFRLPFQMIFLPLAVLLHRSPYGTEPAERFRCTRSTRNERQDFPAPLTLYQTASPCAKVFPDRICSGAATRLSLDVVHIYNLLLYSAVVIWLSL